MIATVIAVAVVDVAVDVDADVAVAVVVAVLDAGVAVAVAVAVHDAVVVDVDVAAVAVVVRGVGRIDPLSHLAPQTQCLPRPLLVARIDPHPLPPPPLLLRPGVPRTNTHS